MKKRWIMLTDHYQNLRKQSVNTLSKIISQNLHYVLPVKLLNTVDESTIGDTHLITIGCLETNTILKTCAEKGLLDVPEQEQSYSIYVGESIFNPQCQIIAIAGSDEAGVLYGVMDFCNRYCGSTLYQEGYLWSGSFFDNRFDQPLSPWRVSRSPAIKTRALWTWGHVIYDYRGFFDNMAKLRLNEAVIWNDHVPLNANDVVDYAHKLGIKVIWGFAWGWTSHCAEFVKAFRPETLPRLKESILQTYESQYAHTGGDGIYFQSFTEVSEDRIGEKSIAQIVTELVNDVANTLLEKYPHLHIQFGLHATSVRSHLDVMKGVDKRVHIIWEDCGAFPYNYLTDKIDSFSETLQLTEELLSLRGQDEQFGAVLKGMMNLDWLQFEHFSDSYILGECSESFIRTRQAQKNRIWKIVQAGWLKNAEYAQKIIALISEKGHTPILEALVEDAMFENEIMLPVALYAELLWTPDADLPTLLEEVSKFPCVCFANN